MGADTSALAVRRSVTRAGVLILIYGIAGLCMAATVAVITGMGMLRLLQSSIEGGQRVATVSTTAW